MNRWYNKYLKVYDRPFDDVPKEITDNIRNNMSKIECDKPVVTVSVIAYNEERHLLSCLWSLSEMICKYPVEIIGIDNDSKDKTPEIYKACGITFYTEYQHSCGFARLCGLNHAKGKYHINIDGDTMYPPKYVETMVDKLCKKDVVGVSSTWSYFPDKDHSRLGIYLYTFIRDIHLRLQSIKRPELSVRGLVFAYNVDYARRVGIRTDIRRGEDGSLALQLKQFGKIAFIHNRKARAVTGFGTVAADGSFFNSFKVRAIRALKGIGGIFTTKKEYKDEDNNLIK